MFYAEIKDNPLLIFGFTMAFSTLAFVVTRLLVQLLYTRWLVRFRLFQRLIENLGRKKVLSAGSRGFIGLALFVAVPVPGSGVYSGAVLSWMMGLGWGPAFLAVVPATAVSNVIVTAGLMGLMRVS